MDGADDEGAVALYEVIITSLVALSSPPSFLMLSFNSIAVPSSQILQVTLWSKEKAVSSVSFDMFYAAYPTLISVL